MRRVRTLALLVLTTLLVSSCGGAVATVERPEGRGAPEIIAVGAADSPSPEAMKIGSFEKPDGAPKYEVIERREIRRDGVRAARLLIDTKAESEAEYELIARDVKAGHASYDAVSAEVTDTSSGFGYNGAILVFNTPEGSFYMGFYYSPPNNRGFIVDVAE